MQFSKAFKGLPQDRIEEAFDRFAREEFRQGQQIVKEGEPVSKMYIVKMGELACTRGGQPVTAIQEAGGFSYFGEQAVLVSKFPLQCGLWSCTVIVMLQTWHSKGNSACHCCTRSGRFHLLLASRLCWLVCLTCRVYCASWA